MNTGYRGKPQMLQTTTKQGYTQDQILSKAEQAVKNAPGVSVQDCPMMHAGFVKLTVADEMGVSIVLGTDIADMQRAGFVLQSVYTSRNDNIPGQELCALFRYGGN